MSMSDSLSKKFGKMTISEKFIFLGALVAFICTSGFAFPNLLHDDEYTKKFT